MKCWNSTRCDIYRSVCCSSVRMKQLQFLFSNNRGPEVFWGIMTLIIICHQNDNDHHHHWDETLWTVPVASESIRFYMSTYSAHYTLMNMPRCIIMSANISRKRVLFIDSKTLELFFHQIALRRSYRKQAVTLGTQITRDQLIMQILIFFLVHETMCMIYP